MLLCVHLRNNDAYFYVDSFNSEDRFEVLVSDILDELTLLATYGPDPSLGNNYRTRDVTSPWATTTRRVM